MHSRAEVFDLKSELTFKYLQVKCGIGWDSLYRNLNSRGEMETCGSVS